MSVGLLQKSFSADILNIHWIFRDGTLDEHITLHIIQVYFLHCYKPLGHSSGLLFRKSVLISPQE